MNVVQTSKVYISTIHDVDGPRLPAQVVQDIDVVDFALCDTDNRWDVSPEVQKGVEFDRCFSFAKLGPRK